MKIIITMRHFQSLWITNRITHTGYIGSDNGNRHFQKMKQPKAQTGFSLDNFDFTITTACEFHETKEKSF